MSLTGQHSSKSLIGQRVAGLTILQEAAHGARSRVYLASDGEIVKAIKVFLPKYRHYAERELAFGRGLKHPNLNPVEARLELGEDVGLVMPFVSGQRLGTYFHLSFRDFVEIFRGVLSALGYLHASGIIHRDVKPENIIVDRERTAHLIDFDLAVRADEAAAKRTVVGTIAYISPEQAQGSAAGKGSDLYAAGIILYRVLTGEVPFTGKASEVANAHRFETPRQPSSFDPRYQPFDAFFERLLAKQQTERFQTAGEVIAALNVLL